MDFDRSRLLHGMAGFVGSGESVRGAVNRFDFDAARERGPDVFDGWVESHGFGIHHPIAEFARCAFGERSREF